MLPVVRGDARDDAADRPLLGRARRVHARRSASGSGRSTPRRGASLGGVFLWLAWQLRREPTPRRAACCSTTRSLYLALLFVAMAVDPVVAVKRD